MSEVKEDEVPSPDAVVTTLDKDGNITSDTIEVGEVGFDPSAAVAHALNGEPLEFENQIKLGLADRLQNAVERKRDEVAQAIFGPQDQEVETDNLDADEEESDEEEVDPDNTED
jgi:hypothetical protein